MTLGNKIASLLNENRLKQKDLADYLGVAEPTVSDYINNRKTPKLEKLNKICDFFGVSLDTLLERKNEPSQKSVRIPVYKRIPGDVPLEDVKDIVGFENIPIEMTRGGHEFFAVSIQSNSMSPKYEAGDVLICRRTDSCLSSDYAIIIVGKSDAILRTIITEPDGLLLEPINSAFPSKFYSNKEVEDIPVTIIGVVCEMRCKF